MADSVVSVRNVSRRFGKIQALSGVSFEVPQRSIFGLLGPNGAGKTTLFSIAANFLSADSGAIEVLDHDVRSISRLRGRLTILPQDALFQRNVPIREQLTFFRLLEGAPRREAEQQVDETLKMVGLGEYTHRRVNALSHGMIKRLGVAQAFLGEPEVILLDEPTSGLDPKNARQIRDLVRQFLEERATIVISSHNLGEIQELCDHVAILDKGTIVAAGSVDEITSSGRRVEFRLQRPLTDVERANLIALDGIAFLEDRGPQRYVAVLELRVGTRDLDSLLGTLERSLLDMGLVLRELREGNTLEEEFLKLTTDGDAGED